MNEKQLTEMYWKLDMAGDIIFELVKALSRCDDADNLGDACHAAHMACDWVCDAMKAIKKVRDGEE